MSILGTNIQTSPIRKQLLEKIPIMIAQNFDLHEGSIFGTDVVLACQTGENVFTPAQVKKMMAVLEQKTGHIAIYVTDRIASYNVTRLIASRVNFIIPQKQMFLPSLLIDLKKERAIGTDLKERIPPFAQLLLLYHIQVEALDGWGASKLTDRFDVSYATTNRALRWLADKALIKLGEAKSKQIYFSYTRREIWEAALPFLRSPVEKVLYTDENIDAMLGGINALSVYTMINEESSQTFVIYKNEWKALKVNADKEFGIKRIEIWRYDPHLLSVEKTVDKLSLYLSLRDNEDERVQIELDNLINEIQW